jgi:hypothetical protein
MNHSEVEAIVSKAAYRGGVLGVRFICSEEEQISPWLYSPSRKKPKVSIKEPLPDLIELVLGNQVYVVKEDLSPQLRNRLIRLAAFLIIKYSVNTLVLVHGKQLLHQRTDRLADFLDIPRESIGQIATGKLRPTGLIDVAMIQGLCKKGVVDDIVAAYGLWLLMSVTTFQLEVLKLCQDKAKPDT